MNTIYLIVDKPIIWTPPLYGTFYIGVVQKSKTSKIFHFCASGCQHDTFIGNNDSIPAIYSSLGESIGTEMQLVPTQINEPMKFYYLNQDLKPLTGIIPKLKLKIIY